MGIVLVSENHVHILFVENGIIGTSGIYTLNANGCPVKKKSTL